MASAAPKTLELPPKLKQLYELLNGEGEVEILDIFNALVGADEDKPQRQAQQYLGPYITKLNRRLREHGAVVRPGRLKGTYSLQSL